MAREVLESIVTWSEELPPPTPVVGARIPGGE
jgi:hypothetical protein